MKFILFILLIIIITFTVKNVETMIVDLKCNKSDKDIYMCKEENNINLLIRDINYKLENFKEIAQKQYMIYKNEHKSKQNELEKTFGKIDI